MVEDHRAEKKPEGMLHEAEQGVSGHITKTLHDVSEARDEVMHELFSQLFGGSKETK